MRYDERPTAEAEVLIDAPVDRVWELVTDINLPAQFSNEFRGATWIDAGPAVGARFVGRNWHKAMGEWETVSIVGGVGERFGEVDGVIDAGRGGGGPTRRQADAGGDAEADGADRERQLGEAADGKRGVHGDLLSSRDEGDRAAPRLG
jgi:hypothetical protein